MTEEKKMAGNIPATYAEAVDYIEDLPRFTEKHTLEHTREFLRRLGNPCQDRKVIHVAGTNGKGSVCAYMQAILSAEGKKTGFFTSPHLVRINERIQLDRNPVSDEDFYEAFVKTLMTVRKMEEEGIAHPSYFEFLFGMGMTVFEASDAEYIILETGLGGRLDATNSIEHPFLTVITSISLDHTDILGDTVEQIAFEKAGIIKEKVPVFFDGNNPKASAVIRKVAEEKEAPCREISNHAYKIKEVKRNHIAFSRQSAYDKDTVWEVPGCALYQVTNAELAVQAMEYAFADQEVHKERWKDAVSQMHWEGRMELVAPHFTVDGAHNPGALAEFAKSLDALLKTEENQEKPVILFSAVSDKKYEQMIEFLCQKVDAKAYIVTEIDGYRKVPAKDLFQLFQKYTDRPVYMETTIENAISRAYKERGEGEIYCLGSLYLVGLVKKYVAGGGSHVGL